MTAWLIVGAVVAAPCVAAEPRPTLTSAADNVAFAVQAICIPYVLDGADVAALPLKRPLVAADGWKRLGAPQMNLTVVRVGMAGFVHVGVGDMAGRRRCELSAQDADPQVLRQVALHELSLRPERFGPTKSRYLPGRFATEDMLCSAADSGKPDLGALLSASAGGRGAVAILFSLFASPRSPSCDHDGVRMNYRTLIEPG